MRDFVFSTVGEVIIRYQGAAALGEIVASKFDVHRVLVVTDKGLVATGLLKPALASLQKAGFDVTVFDDVVADPPESVILDLGAVAANFDMVIGFGGGSSMDAAKLGAILAKGKQQLQTMYGVGNVTSDRLPLMLVPTTSGTGSEVTPISVVTTGETTKSGIIAPALYADCALLDASLTLDLPPDVTAATGVDAMVHAIEAYTCKNAKNPLSDVLAKQALSLLIEAVPRAYKNGHDRTAREAALLGSMLAGKAFANAPVAAVHALAYPLGGIYHLPHGLSNALVLPYVLRFNMSKATTMYAELYTSITGDAAGAQEARAEKFVELMVDICAQVGINLPLKSFGISHNELPRLAEAAMIHTRLLVNNPREVTYEDALRVYEQAW